MSEGPELVEVKVSGLAIDGRSQTPVVLLQEAQGERVLPIWIGTAEAQAIAMELAGKKFQRPLTHDLMRTIIDGLQAVLVRIDITELQDNTFYAKIYLRRQSELIAIDARPSDSIALALRTSSPIFVSESLIRGTASEVHPPGETDPEALRKYLENLDLEDFGKFNI